MCSPCSVDRLNVADMTAFAADYSAKKRRDMHLYMRESRGKCGYIYTLVTLELEFAFWELASMKLNPKLGWVGANTVFLSASNVGVIA